MKTHYKNLGVPETATAAEIKRAYRSKAKNHHPDKGGDTMEFASISKAYEILSNPAQKLLYDATGEDARPPIETEIQNVLMNAFNQALAQGQDVELIAFVRHGLIEGAKAIPLERAKLEKRQAKLQAKRGKIKTDKVNLVWLIIDGELKNIAAALLQLDHQSEVSKACLLALDAYEEEWEAPVVKIITLQDYAQGEFTIRYAR